VEFEDEINEFYFYLFTKKGERIDYKEGTYSGFLLYPTSGIETEQTQEFIRSIIEKGENEQVEFKERIPKDYKEFVESIVAFANKKGGTIFLGVDDKCNIKGAISEDLDEEKLRNIVRSHCEPVIEINTKIEEIDDKKIVLIKVPEGEDKPYFVKERGPFIRVGSSDRVMTRFELDQIYGKKGKQSTVIQY
jgi:ATP-dependent DNA helicase RecG